MNEKDKQAITEALAKSLPGLTGIWVFGSHATGEAKDGSDFDIAVLADASAGRAVLFELAGELADRLGKEVDLIDLREASTVLRSQILSHGVPLYRHPGRQAEIEAFLDFVYSDYARLNEERAGILADVRARGSIHGG